MAYCDRYGFDGVIVACTGKNYSGMADDAQIRYITRQETFLDTINAWYETHADRSLFFCGKPQYWVDKGFLAQCDYIILPAIDAQSVSELSLVLVQALVAEVPTDRFVIQVSTVSVTDPTDETGYFLGMDEDGKSRLRAVKAAAQWTLAASDGSKAGLFIADAQNDYFNISMVYRNIREAISIMNPAPKNR